LGFGSAGAGVLSGCYALGVFIGAATTSVVASRHGGKPVLATGTVTMVVASVLFGLAHDAAPLDAARVAQGLGAGMIWAGGLTWVASSAAPDRRATATGSAIGLAVAGTIVGPPLGGLAVATSQEFVFSALVPIILLGALVLVVRTPRRDAVHLDGGLLNLFRGRHRARTIGAVWVMLLPATALGLLNVLGPLRLDASGAAVGVLTFVYVLAGVAEGATSSLAGRLADRGDPHVLVRRFLLVLAVIISAFTLASSTVSLAVLIVALGATFGLLWAPGNTRTHEVARSAGVDDSHVAALFTFCFAGGQVLGGTGGGALADAGGNALPSLLLVAAAAITASAVRATRTGLT
jgi:predicted MFS family arabinose efflux permease